MCKYVINIFASFTLLLFSISCTDVKNDTYLHFAVEGSQYQSGEVEFYYSKLISSNRYHFVIDRGVQSSQKTPRGQIQWIMESNSLEELQGMEIDFSEVASEARANHFAEPNVFFTLEKENISVAPPLTSVDSNMIIKISRIDEKFVEGSFVGTNFKYFSDPDKVSKAVNITGSFRARLNRGER